jgi:hypothetical protein
VLTYSFTIYFEGNLIKSDIVEAKMYFPDYSKYWSFDVNKYDENTKSLSQSGFYLDTSIFELPIGQLTARVDFIDGTFKNGDFRIGAPGKIFSYSDKYSYAYSADDEASPIFPSISIPALRRPIISTAGKTNSQIIISFVINDSHISNGWINFYNDNGYIGCTNYFRNSYNGACSSIVNNGEGFYNQVNDINYLTIMQSNIFGSNNSIISEEIFSSIKKCRLVVVDGLQYETTYEHSNYDYKSYSSFTIIN